MPVPDFFFAGATFAPARGIGVVGAVVTVGASEAATPVPVRGGGRR